MPWPTYCWTVIGCQSNSSLLSGLPIVIRQYTVRVSPPIINSRHFSLILRIVSPSLLVPHCLLSKWPNVATPARRKTMSPLPRLPPLLLVQALLILLKRRTPRRLDELLVVLLVLLSLQPLLFLLSSPPDHLKRPGNPHRQKR
jgi:hypothetical protein